VANLLQGSSSLIDEQVFLACAWRKLDDRNRAISEAWAREQAARAAGLSSQSAS